jgi:hypothetical protein
VLVADRTDPDWEPTVKLPAAASVAAGKRQLEAVGTSR